MSLHHQVGKSRVFSVLGFIGLRLSGFGLLGVSGLGPGLAWMFDILHVYLGLFTTQIPRISGCMFLGTIPRPSKDAHQGPRARILGTRVFSPRNPVLPVPESPLPVNRLFPEAPAHPPFFPFTAVSS